MEEEVCADDAGVMDFKDLCTVIRDEDFDIIAG
jgi:hypothetical protein